ncbi:MAG: hypothetical protein JWO91_3555 [Acidobacteriaceae bacterium]|nr:hypothetical protein [Acidobacteriaceae bacterium]
MRAACFGQQPSLTPEELIAKYLDAVGAEKISSITTLSEKGEVTGNLDTSHRFSPPSLRKDHGSYEFYFKLPDRRLGVTRIGDVILWASGCDGKVSWYFSTYAGLHQDKPKPGSESHCEVGYHLGLLRLRKENAKFQMKGIKKFEGQMVFVLRAESPKSEIADTLYFDTQSYLLVGWKSGGVETAYSDYREVSGAKFPFRTVQKTENSTVTTILQELEINTPIDDTRFTPPMAPSRDKKSQTAQADSKSQQKPGENTSAEKKPELNSAQAPVLPPTPAKTPEAAKVTSTPQLEPKAASTPEKKPEVNSAQGVVYWNTKSFVECPISELQESVPELKGLKTAESQEQLPVLLDKIGARAVAMFHKMPDLISREVVLESQGNHKPTRREFSYLMLSHRGNQSVTLEEYREDLQVNASRANVPLNPRPPAADGSGSSLEDLRRRSQQASMRSAGTPPLAQGFAYTWVLLYPSNRSESTFRYLGEQKIDHHKTFVVAFSQKPKAVRWPGQLKFQDKSLPIFHQGVAWVDASDFRIIRLRTDLQFPVPEAELRSLTAELHFADMTVAGIGSLWLPHQVLITSDVGGTTFHDEHDYANYRAYGVKTKLVLAP